ncbi:MAG TPA: glycosyltransferase family 39 protein, partial [Candidatus Baltobacteraceae bacterium]|nr:glycosyltransferase family 39 protein [Candidatus Baltobacteraceae bacterium]
MNARLRATIAAISIVVWIGVVCRGVFHAGDHRLFAQNLQHLPDILTHVPRNAGYIVPVLAFVVSGFGAGDLICGALGICTSNRWARFAFALCLGQACWLAAVVAVGVPGFLNRPVLGALLAAGLISSAARWYMTRERWRDSTGHPAAVPSKWVRVATAACIALLAFDLYLALLGALMPETGFDARFYHLAEAKRYADHGAIYNLAASQHSVEMALPQNQEILYAAIVKLFGLPAAKILSWSNLLLATIAIVGFAGEFFGSETAGTLAALLFVSTPIVTLTATTASNDLSQTPYTLLALYAFFAWTRDRAKVGWLAAAGVFCGFCFGIKPFAVFTILTLGAFVAAFAFRRPLRPLATFGLGCLLGALPDLVREAVVTGDPFFPIGAGLMHSAFWWPAQEQAMRDSIHAFGADTAWPVLFKLPWALTMEANRYRNLLGPLFIFV